MGGQWILSGHSFGFWPDGKLMSILSLGFAFLGKGADCLPMVLLRNDCNEQILSLSNSSFVAVGVFDD